jgi:S-adenosylmethionine:tRNA-ribosyltransferase-isomerase (queuine synthetase)
VVAVHQLLLQLQAVVAITLQAADANGLKVVAINAVVLRAVEVAAV